MRTNAASAGFTLVELLVVLGVIGVLFTLTFINLGKPQTTASLQSTTDMLVADIKAQQLLAISGDDDGTGAQQPHGVQLAANSYTLFAGISFDGSSATNFAIVPGDPISFSTNLPDDAILFEKSSGDVHNFIDGNNTITVHAGDASRVVTINRLGTVTVQ